MKIIQSRASNARGFSLIEVLIAVVVLSTGLLALAALQGSLTRASAEAKVRGRVAALLSARLDQLRVTGYDSIASGANDSCATATGGDWVPADFCTETGIGSLTATQTMSEWVGAVGGANFAVGTPGVSDPQFKRVAIEATWTDSGGVDHSLSMSSDYSALAITSNLLPNPDEEGAKNLGPIVRQDNPATEGMIPIALGGDDYTAATNPRPEILGDKKNQTIVGTRFDVLTYSGTDEATIQKRFETTVIKCSCQYGVSNDQQNGVREVPQWPAVWTGERYDVYKPDPVAAAPGAATPAGPVTGQPEVCTECCRDHHDDDANGVAKFDPERAGEHTHYSNVGYGVLIAADTSSGKYVEACRLIRVDGLWRTAADMYSRHFALLETESVSGVQAKTGVPTTTSVAGYESFVKDYLDAYDGGSSTAPGNADSLFAATALADTPAQIDIETPSSDDFRYMHGRGLYVDYLEAEARTKISDVLTERRANGDCLAGSSDLPDCVLPYLPFTTINVTELASWVADDESVIAVHSDSSLVYNPLEPSRGRTLGDAAGTANALVKMGRSNAAVALSDPIDFDGATAGTEDQMVSTDSQEFEVGGDPGTGSGDDFYVNFVGLDAQTPNALWTVDSQTSECLGAGATADRRCTTESTLSGQGGSVTVLDYWSIGDPVSESMTWTCGNKTAVFTVSRPTFENWEVSTASIKRYLDGSAVGVEIVGNVGSPLPSDGAESEEATIVFASIPKDSVVEVIFAMQSPVIKATPDSVNCKIAGSKLTPAWVEGWAQP